MNVLFLSRTDWGGCAWFLSQAVDALEGYSARHVRWADPYYTRYPYGLLAPKQRKWPSLWAWADVVHVYDQPGSIADVMPPKPTVVTYNGTLYRRTHVRHDKEAAIKGWLVTATTLDLTMGTAAHWLPCARPDPSHLLGLSKFDTFTVCHAPTKRMTKGTADIEQALKDLPGVRLDVIERVSWEECQRRKARAHVLIDQFNLGYGCNSVEAWLLGIPVISGAHDLALLEAIEREAGRLPFVAATPDTVREAVIALRDDGDLYYEMAWRGHKFALKHHLADAVARMALPLYEEVADRFEDWCSVHGRVPGEGGLALMEYMGRKDGTQTHFGGATGQEYLFGRARRFGWVDADDATFMLRRRRWRKTADFRRVT